MVGRADEIGIMMLAVLDLGFVNHAALSGC
jgi:hypothetical protein